MSHGRLRLVAYVHSRDDERRTRHWLSPASAEPVRIRFLQQPLRPIRGGARAGPGALESHRHVGVVPLRRCRSCAARSSSLRRRAPRARGDEHLGRGRAGSARRARYARVAGDVEPRSSRSSPSAASRFESVHSAGDRVDEFELVDQIILLYVAGHETTVNLIGNGTLALLRNRDELARLRDDPALDANAIEELLRYDSPVQMSRRITLEPFEIDGKEIEAGSFLMTSLGSANRDPRKFGDDAGRLDLGRAAANQHVSFGGGFHSCLG